MFGFGTGELVVVLVIVVMLFGAKRIPEIMHGLGKGIRTFKRSMDGEEQPETPSPAPPQAESGRRQKEETPESK